MYVIFSHGMRIFPALKSSVDDKTPTQGNYLGRIYETILQDNCLINYFGELELANGIVA